MKTGVATLPLHFGRVPSWLFEKMVRLGREISLTIVEEFSPQVFLAKLADPYWFQSFGCVLGFDWHSSGLTTTVCGALKYGLVGLEKDTGIFIAGGKGRTSRKTPQELTALGQKFSFDSNPLVYASRMSAKVDNTALQDGYQLYHHTFFGTIKEGNWAVVQQGMSLDRLGMKKGWARRYHWLSDTLHDFVCEPHSGIISHAQGRALNMTAKEAEECRKVSAKLSCQKPEKLISQVSKIQTLKMPKEHPVSLVNLNPKILKKIFLKTYEQKPENFKALLGITGVGPKTIRALALISELIYGTPPSYRDPAKFSFAHGGKDGTPYPVNKEEYEKSIEILRLAIRKAKIGQREKIEAIRQLNL